MSDDGNGLKMRYNRERRLERASPEVKSLYDRRSGKRRGFFFFMKGNKGLLLTFGTVIMFALIAIGLPYLLGQDRGKKIGPYRAFVDAELENGEIAMSVLLTRPSERSRKGESDTILVRTSTDGSLFTAREFALSGSKEERFFFRLPVEFPPAEVECLLSTGNSQISLRVPLGGGTDADETP